MEVGFNKTEGAKCLEVASVSPPPKVNSLRREKILLAHLAHVNPDNNRLVLIPLVKPNLKLIQQLLTRITGSIPVKIK